MNPHNAPRIAWRVVVDKCEDSIACGHLITCENVSIDLLQNCYNPLFFNMPPVVFRRFLPFDAQKKTPRINNETGRFSGLESVGKRINPEWIPTIGKRMVP